jgi:peptidase C13-like protein
MDRERHGSRFGADFAENLAAGFRMAVFLPPLPALKASWPQLLALIALQLLIVFACNFLEVGSGGQLNVFSVPGVTFGVVLALVSACVLSFAAGRSDQTLVLLVAFAALSIPLELAGQFHVYALTHQLISYRGAGGWLLYSLPHYWLALAAGIAAARLLTLPGLRRAGLVVLAVAVLGFPSSAVYRERRLWTKAYDPEEAAAFQRQHMSLTQEDVFYLQPKLLERELAAVAPGRRNTIDLYFVAAAGWAGQDVFMKEVNSVAKLFEERFDARGRVIRLINNPKSVSQSPIASVTGLRQALARVAQAMDSDDDILFLFLTSHGSKDHRFSLEFYPMTFHELTPPRLRQLLDESGIKRRVLVVSACYSGGFVDALKDENSLVITAAAPHKNSFGCSNDADFTYFGKAYFDEALRETHSFIDAFAIAKPRIEQREKQSDYEPSDPRIFIGEAIRAPLAQLERELRAGRPARTHEVSQD